MTMILIGLAIAGAGGFGYWMAGRRRREESGNDPATKGPRRIIEEN